MISSPNSAKGMTMIELLIAMAVASIVMAILYSTYQLQQKSYVTQQLVTDMQQNARAAMALMKREIRMAGYDPISVDGVDNDGLNGVDDVKIQLTSDISGDGDVSDTNEDVTYSLVGSDLMRQDGAAAPQIVAYDIEAIGFAYAYDDDLDNQLDSFDDDPDKPVIWAIPQNVTDNKLGKCLDTDQNGVIDASDAVGGVNLPGQIEFGKIKMVKIWLLAKTRYPVRGFRDNRTYIVGKQHITVNDSYKRQLLTATVHCRNMGI
jgi:type IV pilus assembly protein PilW